MSVEWQLCTPDNLPPIGTEVLVVVPSKIDMGKNPVTALCRLIRYAGAQNYYWDNYYGGSNIHLEGSVTHWAYMPTFDYTALLK